jgi:hypothetical protein
MKLETKPTTPIQALAKELGKTADQVHSEIIASCEAIEKEAQAAKHKRRSRSNRTSRIGAWLPV